MDNVLAPRLLPRGPAEGYAAKLARALFVRGLHRDAEDAYRLALVEAPDSAELKLGLANVLATLRRNREAMALYREVLELQPTWADAANGLGYCSDDPVWAAMYFRRAVELDGKQAVYQANLACALLALGKRHAAAAALLEAVSRAPHELELVQPLAVILVDHGHYSAAEFYLSRALRRPENERLDSAWAMYNMREFRYADRIFAEVRYQHPLEPELFALLAEVRLRGGDLSGALRAARNAVVLEPTCASHHRLLARVLERGGKMVFAATARTRAQEIERGTKRLRSDLSEWVASAFHG